MAESQRCELDSAGASEAVAFRQKFTTFKSTFLNHFKAVLSQIFDLNFTETWCIQIIKIYRPISHVGWRHVGPSSAEAFAVRWLFINARQTGLLVAGQKQTLHRSPYSNWLAFKYP